MSKRVVKKTRDTAERGSVSTFKASKKANVDTDSVSDSDEEIDMLVEKSLASFQCSKVSDSKSFSALTDRIFDSKNVRKDLVAANGIMIHHSSKQGTSFETCDRMLEIIFSPCHKRSWYQG